MTRATTAQQSPDPALDGATFPTIRLRPGQLLWRAARRGRGAWWFCACGGCRFDLPEPRGTCHTGTDRVSGILETIGPEWAGGAPLTPAFLRRRVLHATAEARTLPLANLTSREAVGFRITNELSDMTPYDIPQAVARALDAARRSGKRVYGGIRFRTRFDTGSTPRGVALFGEAGVHDDIGGRHEEIGDELMDELTGLGLVIQTPPALTELTVREN